MYYSIMEYRTSLRGFPVEYAALGFLLEEPMHGYALRTRIEQGFGSLWRVASSQLYQVLRRLETHALLERAATEADAGPSRIVYRVTDKGASTFWDWAEAPVHAMRDVRVEFVGKLYFTRRLRLSAVGPLIDRQIAALKSMQEHIQSHAPSESDDPTLQSAWQAFQLSTLDQFDQWLRELRPPLSSP
jgi:DNA-binding PadR family transcriptional regulator